MRTIPKGYSTDKVFFFLHRFSTPSGNVESHYSCFYIGNSIKVALGIGNCALGSYCLAVTRAKHCITLFSCAQMANAQLPMTNCQSNLY